MGDEVDKIALEDVAVDVDATNITAWLHEDKQPIFDISMMMTGSTHLIGLGWTFFLMFLGKYMSVTGFSFSNWSNSAYTISILLLWATSGIEFLLFIASCFSLGMLEIYIWYG